MIAAALVVGLSLAVAGQARAAPAAGEAVARATLEIDTIAAGSAGPIIHARLDELGNLRLRRAEILPGRGARDPWIKISVRAVASEEPGYVIRSALLFKGKPVADSAHETDCRLCTETEAVERATAEVERLVPLVREHAQQPATRRSEPDAAASRAVGPSRGLGGRGKAGIGLLAFGGVSLGVGAGLAALAPRPDPDLPLNVITTRPPGFALLGVGAAAAITGAVLLALDRRSTRPRAGLAPAVVRGGAGLVFVGVF